MQSKYSWICDRIKTGISNVLLHTLMEFLAGLSARDFSRDISGTDCKFICAYWIKAVVFCIAVLLVRYSYLWNMLYSGLQRKMACLVFYTVTDA